MPYQYKKDAELYHYGVLGMKWGVRRYQNPDGSLTPKGEKRYYKTDKYGNKKLTYNAIRYNMKTNAKNQRYVDLLDRKLKKDKAFATKIKNHKETLRKEAEAFQDLHEKYYKQSRKRDESRFYDSRDEARRAMRNHPLSGSSAKSYDDIKKYVSKITKDDKRLGKTINLPIGSGTTEAGKYATEMILRKYLDRSLG